MCDKSTSGAETVADSSKKSSPHSTQLLDLVIANHILYD